MSLTQMTKSNLKMSFCFASQEVSKVVDENVTDLARPQTSSQHAYSISKTPLTIHTRTKYKARYESK
jgi:hypothetical protein